MARGQKKLNLKKIIITAMVYIAALCVLLALRNAALHRRRNIDPGRPMVALTFDDGPNDSSSARILDCLEENNAVATFFEVGMNVERYPEVSKRASDMGCEIGSHTYRHINLRNSGVEALENDYALCEEAFKSAIGYMPALLRPPEGAIGSTAKNLYDHPFIGWSVDTEDWLTRDAGSTAAYVENFGNLDGQVILMHSIYGSTADAVEEIVPWLIDRGYQLVTVSELLEYRYGVKPENHVYYAVDFFLYGEDAR